MVELLMLEKLEKQTMQMHNWFVMAVDLIPLLVFYEIMFNFTFLYFFFFFFAFSPAVSRFSLCFMYFNLPASVLSSSNNDKNTHKIHNQHVHLNLNATYSTYINVHIPLSIILHHLLAHIQFYSN